MDVEQNHWLTRLTELQPANWARGLQDTYNEQYEREMEAWTNAHR